MDYNEYIDRCKKVGGRLSYIGKTFYGLPIPIISKGRKIPKVLVCGGVHAREHITSELLLALAERYNGDGAVDFVPMLNIDGVMLEQYGTDYFDIGNNLRAFLINVNNGEDFRLWKANLRAVDINVNFDAGWGTGKSNRFSPSPESYVGVKPESEPETFAAANLIRNNRYSGVIAYHSKGEEVYYGFKDNNAYKAEAEKIADFLRYKLKETPDSAGGLKDYYLTLYKGLGLTIEVGKDRFPHPYPVSELDNLIKQHEGVIELIWETANRLN